MGIILTFGALNNKNFNFAQVSSLNKTFGNFAFDGYHYERINILGSAKVTALPRLIHNLILYENIILQEGNFEKISNSEIGFLFGSKPLLFTRQIILSASLNAKLSILNSFDYQIMKQVGLIGKINKNINLNNQINTGLGIKPQIISNKNNQ